MKVSLSRRLIAEALGTAFLLMIVIGSGIMGERLANGNMGITLLANSLSTGLGLAALILIFNPLSAHFNPLVTLALASEKHISWQDVLPYISVQVIAAIAGVTAAHLMFGEPVLSFSTKIRSGWPQWWSEFIATFGLLLVILACVKQKINALPFAVAAYITAAYWFTASTSFANPAVTLARSLSNTFAGIQPNDIVGFMIAQALGAISATILCRWLIPHKEKYF